MDKLLALKNAGKKPKVVKVVPKSDVAVAIENLKFPDYQIKIEINGAEIKSAKLIDDHGDN
jgi:predicted nucleotidyltransferase